MQHRLVLVVEPQCNECSPDAGARDVENGLVSNRGVRGGARPVPKGNSMRGIEGAETIQWSRHSCASVYLIWGFLPTWLPIKVTAWIGVGALRCRHG